MYIPARRGVKFLKNSLYQSVATNSSKGKYFRTHGATRNRFSQHCFGAVQTDFHVAFADLQAFRRFASRQELDFAHDKNGLIDVGELLNCVFEETRSWF